MTARRQFLAVHGKGKRVSSSLFTLHGRPNRLAQCRLGITVTRKLGGAVSRNRIKRLVREVFRAHRAQLVPFLDLVVAARPGILSQSKAEIEKEFLKRFHELARRLA